MKKLPGFLAGMLATTLIGTLSLTALASTDRLTLTADPINIQVNGEVFQPKSADGSDALVFAYNGVTYAPLRALAEAFGLEVGYDAEANMATVNEPGSGESEETGGQSTPESYTFDYSYEEFCELWDSELAGGGGYLVFYAKNPNTVLNWWDSIDKNLREQYLLQICSDADNKLGTDAPPRYMFRSSFNGEHLAIISPGAYNEVSIERN